jgi:hypothetical protein
LIRADYRSVISDPLFQKGAVGWAASLQEFDQAVFTGWLQVFWGMGGGTSDRFDGHELIP